MAKYNSKDYQIQNYDKRKWDEYEKVELAWFAQDARECYGDICRGLNFNGLVDLSDLAKKYENYILKLQELKLFLMIGKRLINT